MIPPFLKKEHIFTNTIIVKNEEKSKRISQKLFKKSKKLFVFSKTLFFLHKKGESTCIFDRIGV